MRMKKPSRIGNGLRIALLVIGISLIATSGAALDRLRIGYGAPTVTMSPLWIAQEGRIFARNGLDVEVLYLESALVQRALIAGEIQYGEMTGALLSAPRLQGADMVMILGFVDRLLFRLLVRPEIHAAGDLKGKRIGTSRFGAAIDRATRLLLGKLGLNPDKDVTFVQIGSEPTLLAALLAGAIDASLLQPPRHPVSTYRARDHPEIDRQEPRHNAPSRQIVRRGDPSYEKQSRDRQKGDQPVYAAQR